MVQYLYETPFDAESQRADIRLWRSLRFGLFVVVGVFTGRTQGNLTGSEATHQRSVAVLELELTQDAGQRNAADGSGENLAVGR